MKKILLLAVLLFFYGFLHARISVGTWNLQNFGDKKPDTVILLMAQTLKNLDVVALQEISTGPGGARAVARLVAALNGLGEQWDYVISDPTSGSNVQERERYAYIWKKSRLKRKGSPALASFCEGPVSREPFLCSFSEEGHEFTLVNFHALPKKKQPETEIKYLRDFPARYAGQHLVFLGDFNCPQSHTVFNPLKKQGYSPALTGVKTTLRQDCSGEQCMASAYDNIFYPQALFRVLDRGILPFYRHYNSNMKAARRVSDHVPVYVILDRI